MDSRELLQDISKKLKKSENISAPELEARWILERATGVDGETHLDFIETAVSKRLEGIPLAYVLGEKEFYSLNFVVNPNVLIPRPESEHIVDEALKWAKNNDVKPARILDLGAGSGCIGLAVIKNLDEAVLCSVDCSVEALDIVDFNAKSLGLHDRSNHLFMRAEELDENDLPEIFNFKADMVLANPPYIDQQDTEIEVNVKKFEPSLALFSDEEGYGSIRRWAKQLKTILAPKCLVLFEIGYQQGQRAKEIFEELDIFDKIEILKDYSGKERIIRAERLK